MADLTPKQEAFCLAYLETGNASEAYRSAYDTSGMADKTVHENASRLLRNGKVAARLLQLQQASQKRHEITIDYLTEQLKLALQKAMADDKGASAAVSAIVALGKLHGLMVDRKHVAGEIDHTHTHVSEPVSETELSGLPACSEQRLRESCTEHRAARKKGWPRHQIQFLGLPYYLGEAEPVIGLQGKDVASAM